MPLAGYVLILAGVMGAAGLALVRVGWGKDRHGTGENYLFLVPGWIFTVLGFVGMLVWGLIWGFNYLGTYQEVQRMEAFYNDTQMAYKYTIDRTEAVVIDVEGTRRGSITDFSYQEQGAAVSDRIREFRAKVDWYNSTLYVYRGMKEVPAIGDTFHEVPADLMPIRLEYSK